MFNFSMQLPYLSLKSFLSIYCNWKHINVALKLFHLLFEAIILIYDIFIDRTPAPDLNSGLFAGLHWKLSMSHCKWHRHYLLILGSRAVPCWPKSLIKHVGESFGTDSQRLYSVFSWRYKFCLIFFVQV